jgi:hypothetical protein
MKTAKKSAPVIPVPKNQKPAFPGAAPLFTAASASKTDKKETKFPDSKMPPKPKPKKK